MADDPVHFIVMRREGAGYSTRGPVACAATYDAAAAQAVALKRRFPAQDFVVMGEVAAIRQASAITVRPHGGKPVVLDAGRAAK